MMLGNLLTALVKCVVRNMIIAFNARPPGIEPDRPILNLIEHVIDQAKTVRATARGLAGKPVNCGIGAVISDKDTVFNVNVIKVT